MKYDGSADGKIAVVRAASSWKEPNFTENSLDALTDITNPILENRPELRRYQPILEAMAERAISGHGKEKRDLSKIFYVNHELRSTKHLADRGAGLGTLILSLVHDVPESKVKGERKQGNEERMLKELYIKELIETTEEAMIKHPRVGKNFVDYFEYGFRPVMELVTTLKGASRYEEYAALADIISYDSVVRAIAAEIKLSDRLDNNSELVVEAEPPNKPCFVPKAWYKENITQKDICNMHDDQDVMRLGFSYIVNRLSKQEPPKTVGGDRVVKNFFKNALLINALRDPGAGLPEKYRGIIRTLETDLITDSLERVPLHADLLLNDKISPLLAYWYMAELSQYSNRSNGIDELTEPSKRNMYDGFVKKELDPLVNPEKDGKLRMRKRMRVQFKALSVLNEFFKKAEENKEFRWPQITAEGIGGIAPAVGRRTNFFKAHWYGWRNRRNHSCVYTKPSDLMQPAMPKKQYRDINV